MILKIKDIHPTEGGDRRRKLTKSGSLRISVEWRDIYLGTITVEDLGPDEEYLYDLLAAVPGPEVGLKPAHPGIVINPTGEEAYVDMNRYREFYLVPDREERTIEIRLPR